MTKARDLSSIIGSSGQIDNAKITLDAAEIPSLDTSKITTGTFADARISASSVSQHAQSFDDNKIVNDISTLALTQASNDNRSAYNTNSQFIDVFQDSSAITNLTNTVRSSDEYIASTYSAIGEFPNDSNTVVLHHFNNSNTDASSNTADLTSNSATFTTAEKKFGTHSLLFTGSQYAITDDLQDVDGSVTAPTTGVFTLEFWYKYTSRNAVDRWIALGSTATTPGGGGTPFFTAGYNNNYWNTYGVLGGGYNWDAGNHPTSSLDTNWHHCAYVRDGSGRLTLFIDGVQKNGDNTWNGLNVQGASNGSSGCIMFGSTPHSTGEYIRGYIDEFRYSNIVRYTPGSDGQTIFTPNLVNYANATGSFENNTITAPSSVSSMGAIITYQDNAGTNALNTDIVLQLSADGGSNYSTATLTALPDFSTGIKMAKVNDLAVTAGTNLKYKISFANQASGSKEARIRGVALQY